MALLVTFVAIDKSNPPEAKKERKATGRTESPSPTPAYQTHKRKKETASRRSLQLVDKLVLSFRGAPQGYLLRGAKRRGDP